MINLINEKFLIFSSPLEYTNNSRIVIFHNFSLSFSRTISSFSVSMNFYAVLLSLCSAFMISVTMSFLKMRKIPHNWRSALIKIFEFQSQFALYQKFAVYFEGMKLLE